MQYIISKVCIFVYYYYLKTILGVHIGVNVFHFMISMTHDINARQRFQVFSCFNVEIWFIERKSWINKIQVNSIDWREIFHSHEKKKDKEVTFVAFEIKINKYLLNFIYDVLNKDTNHK